MDNSRGIAGEELRLAREARGRAEDRVAKLEGEVADIRSKLLVSMRAAARAPVGAASTSAAGSAGDPGEVERLRRQLEEAHAVIRAIEDAYVAGEQRRRGGPPA